MKPFFGCLLSLSLLPSLFAADLASGLVKRFEMPASPIELKTAAKPGRYFDSMSRRAGILGTEGEGFEAWVYPLKLFHDCRLRVAIDGSDETVELGGRTDLVAVRPESVTLTSTHSLFTIRQIFFTPLDSPGSVLLLDIETSRPLTLSVSFVPDLKPMWPAGLGGQYASWSDERRLFIISESRRKYSGLIGSPAGLRGSSTPAHELGKGAVSFDIKIDPQIARKYFYPVVIAGSLTARDAAYEVYDSLLSRIPGEHSNLVRHFRSLRENLLHVETPEADLNLAFEWAKVAIDKGFVDNPDLGTGLIAGWGTSGDSARPGFGWFFGGDTYLNQYAISSYGAFDMMRRAFEFLQKRQRADGKMMHELTQAAGWLRWFEEYPYGYYHGDTTPFYITSLYDYLRQSGDRQFLRESWPSLKRAYQYCRSTDEDGDGLMDNTKAGLGASELGSLLEGLKTDILLGSLSPSAWRAVAAMAGIMGEAPLQEEANALYEKAIKAANEKFWSPELGSFIHALTISGNQNREITAWPSLGIMLGILGGERADATVEKMGSADLSTDWGVRMLAGSSKAYDPAAYNNGAVWPFLTGLAGAAQYERHRGFSGYQAVMANARLTWIGALGSHPELISGDYYRPLETAVPHQLFSSAGIVTPLVRGLFGLRGDAFEGILECKPHLPPSWDNARIRQYRVGAQAVDVAFERTPGKWRATFMGGNGSIKLRLSPAFDLFSRMVRVTVNGKTLTPKMDATSGQDIHFLVETPLEPKTEVLYEYEPGIEIDAPRQAPEIGDSSRGLKILGLGREDSSLTATLEGKAGETYPLRIWTALGIEAVEGGKLADGAQRQILVSFPSTVKGGFSRQTLKIRLAPRMEPLRPPRAKKP